MFWWYPRVVRIGGRFEIASRMAIVGGGRTPVCSPRMMELGLPAGGGEGKRWQTMEARNLDEGV